MEVLVSEVDEAGRAVGLRRLAERVLGVFGFGQGRNAQIFQIIATVIATTGAVLAAYRQWPDAEDYVLVIGFISFSLVGLAYAHRTGEGDPWNN